MYHLGIDVGAVSTKAVLLQGGVIAARAVCETGSAVKVSIETSLHEVLEAAHITLDGIADIVATGYGRISVPFARRKITEVTCHARGVLYFLPGVRTIIDIGGQDSKGIRLDEEGNVVDFVMNDKCAAGTGRFLEVMARVLGLNINELGVLSGVSEDPCVISNVCTVFAESEVVSLRAEGRACEDIIAGVHRSIARRIAMMLSPMGYSSPVVLTGGVACNQGVVYALNQELGLSLTIPPDPQITGALGAALIAAEKAIYTPPFS